jgi:hypothetical protein
MPLSNMSRHDDIDDIHGTLLVTYKESLEEYSINNPWASKDILLDVKRDDVFNVNGLGRLKVIQVEHYPSVHQFLNMIEVVVTAKWVGDAWNPVTTALVNSTLAEVNRQIAIDAERKLWEEA